MLWVVLALMCMLAIGFSIWPLTRNLSRHGLLAGVAIVFVVVASAGLYYGKGRPDVPSGASTPGGPDVAAMVASLAARLESQPDDVDGWKMLGRSYTTLGNSEGAVAAWERAVELTSGRDAGALVGLGEALLSRDEQSMSPRSISLFENALAIEPNNPSALFWGGIAAFNRGDQGAAADRWELLLGTNPPEELRPILEQRIAVWRGETVPAAAPPSPAPVDGAGDAPRVVAASLSVADNAAAALPADATVFIIARDPAQPSPPIAVVRRRLAELPMVVDLGNKDSMIPGRELANFSEFELLARVSLTGSPAAQPGDWYGSTIIRPAESDQVDLSISRQVE